MHVQGWNSNTREIVAVGQAPWTGRKFHRAKNWRREKLLVEMDLERCGRACLLAQVAGVKVFDCSLICGLCVWAESITSILMDEHVGPLTRARSRYVRSASHTNRNKRGPTFHHRYGITKIL